MNLLKKAQEAAGVGPQTQPFSPKKRTEAAASHGSSQRDHRKVLYRLPQQMKDDKGRPLKEEGGLRVPYTDEEVKQYAGTDYANGMLVAVYDGEVRDADVRDGYGAYTYTRGETFEGNWRNNKRNGLGLLTMNSGHKYEGDWKEDKMHGTGREVFAKGEIYTGDYQKGRMHGTGVLDYNHTGSIFEGGWADGRKQGKGRILYANGDVFEGTWEKGRRQGAGTTTYAKGGHVYASQWVDGRMVGQMRHVDTSRAPPPQSPARDKRIKQDKTTLLPSDLTTFRPKSDAQEVPTEHLLRLQMAFERIDREFIGVVSMRELEDLWSSAKMGDTALLEALDRDGSGSVDLYTLYTAWYPLVPRRDIERHLSTYVTPDEVLRHRGECCGIVSTSHGKGFLHICAGKDLSFERLKSVGCIMGGERFSEAQFKKAVARSGRGTISFVEMLDVWYPHVSYDMVARAEVTYLPDEDAIAVQMDFSALASDGILMIDEFETAQLAWQSWLSESTASGGAADGLPATPFTDLASTPTVPLYSTMVPGPFLGEPLWPVGPISVTVKMLQSIDHMKGGWVSLTDLLCFCYPNIECAWTQIRFLGRSSNASECECDIHKLTGDDIAEQLGG